MSAQEPALSTDSAIQLVEQTLLKNVAEMLDNQALACAEGQCFGHVDGLQFGAEMVRELAKEIKR